MHRRTVIGALAGSSLATITGGFTDGVEVTSAKDGFDVTSAREGDGNASARDGDGNGSASEGVGVDSATDDGDPDLDGSVPDGPVDRPDETGTVRFALAPYELTECGTTCREVTSTLTNTGDAAATDVRAIVTVSTGDTHVWETRDEVGRLAPGAEVTRTHRVEVDLGTALAIREHGRLTIETLITSDQRTERIVRVEHV